MEHERHCIVSPTKHIYSYCPHCGQYNKNEKWRLIYCSENCKNIYHICDDFKNSKISVSEAYSELSKYEIPNMEDINEVIKSTVTEILEEGRPKKKKKIVNEIAETPIEEIIEEPVVTALIEENLIEIE